MKKKEPNVPNMILAGYLRDVLEEVGMSILDFAKLMDITYEHARRIYRGSSIPSKSLLKLISIQLELDLRELERMATADKMAVTMERDYPSITEDQRNELFKVMRSWVDGGGDQKQRASNTVAA